VDAADLDDRKARREIARRFREDFWNTGDPALADALIAPGCVVHGRIPLATDFARGPEALRQLVLFYHLAFSDIAVTADQIVVEGDTAVVRWTARGRHTGDLLGFPPTHRETVTTGIDMLRIDRGEGGEGGKIVEGWVSWDVLSLLEQLLATAPPASGDPAGAGFLSLLARLR
jgi:predicted ester cyclase